LDDVLVVGAVLAGVVVVVSGDGRRPDGVRKRAGGQLRRDLDVVVVVVTFDEERGAIVVEFHVDVNRLMVDFYVDDFFFRLEDPEFSESDVERRGEV